MPDAPGVRRRRALAGSLVALVSLGASPGLLFHASFDSGPVAEHATGRSDPGLFLQPDARQRSARFRSVPGKFGRGVTGVMGSFELLGNVLPERGTIAFFARVVGADLGDYPLAIRTLDSYYWRNYLVAGRLGASLAAWVSDEALVPDSSTRAPQGSGLAADRWRHLAIAWDQAYGLRFYLDGELVASSWGQRSWLSRGVDPAELGLAWEQGNVAYDELYIFDRALSDAQIRELALANRAPRAADLPPLDFDARRQANRLRELGWNTAEGRARIELDARGRGELAIRQVVPLDARALLAEAGAVFDGKLGQGWPSRSLVGYEYGGGNGLAVELGEDFDTLVLEGRFAGSIHAGRHQLEPRAAPLHVLDGKEFRTRWRPRERMRGWLTFFWNEASSAQTSQIVELGFFRTQAGALDARKPGQTWHLDSAASEPAPAPLALEIPGRFGPGDRKRLSARAEPAPQARARLAALRFHHVVLPARARDWGLGALRIGFDLRGELDGLPLRVELRDPLQPGRRLAAFDLELAARAHPGAAQLDLLLDVGPRVVPAGRPVWLAIVPGRDVDLLVGKGASSRVEILELPLAEAAPGFAERELPVVRTLFRGLSEDRPWGWYEQPERELAAFNPLARQLFAPLALLRAHTPGEPRVAALWSWTHKQLQSRSPVEPLPVATQPAAPRWALLQRELRTLAHEVLQWWIENRQAPSGEFGDGWNDDTDLIQNFPGLALQGDPAGRLRSSARAVADGVYAAGRMRGGLNTTPFDPLHAYEEGMNAQQVMALLEPGNPVYLERLMESARAIEERLTLRYAPGRRAFRSAHFGADGVEAGAWSYDSLQHAILLGPALAVAYYNRNPRATSAAREWLDGWLDEYARIEPGGKGPAFASRRSPDGKVLERDWLPRGWGLVSIFPALHALTGDARYRDAVRFWTGDPFLEHGADLHLLLELIDARRNSAALLEWSRAAPIDRMADDDLGDLARRRYAETELLGSAAPAEQAMAACIGKLRRERLAYTWAEPIADRIWLPFAPLAVMAQGGLSHQRNQLWPQHHVSWEGLSDLTAWVREKSDSRLRIWLYSFAPRGESGALRLWRARAGRYRVTLGPDSDLDGAPDGAVPEQMELGRFALVPVTVPPGRLIALELELLGAALPETPLPDLALSAPLRADGRLEVTLHNLGGAPARDVVVRVTGADGREIAERSVAALEAPLDLVPRRRSVVFEAFTARGGIRVEADPAGRIRELNEHNNSLRIE